MVKASKVTAIIYSTPSCQACKQAAAWLKKQGVEVEERSYQEAPFQVWGLPVIEIAGEVVTGFDKAKLSEALRRLGK